MEKTYTPADLGKPVDNSPPTQWSKRLPAVMTSDMFFAYANWMYEVAAYAGGKNPKLRPCPTSGCMYSMSMLFGFGWAATMDQTEVAMLSEFIGHALKSEGL